MEHQSLDVQMVRAALHLPLLGRAAQLEMAVRPRPGDRPDLPNPCPREAAVLMLLYPRHGELMLPLTQRTDTVEMHRGQISLPGGAREPHDRDFAHTALRETCEELGIPEGAVQLLGALSPLYIPPSRFCVYPYVGYVSAPPLLHPDPAEVAAVIEVPLRHLLEPDTRQVEVHWRNNQRFEVPIYRVAEQKVWGATAMMLAELVALLRGVQAPTDAATN